MTNPLLGSVLRLREKAKHVAKPQVRTPYRRRKKAIKLTQDERRAKQVARDAKKTRLANVLNKTRAVVMEHAVALAKEFPEHDKEYYYRLIMQLPSKKSKRGISPWCAFLSMRMEQHNEELAAENGEGARRDRVTERKVLQEISEAWAAMTSEEKHAATADKVKELEARRENRLQAVHNTNVSACHDARVTLKNVKTELENFHKRTGTAVLMVATRGSIDAFGDPMVHHSDQRVQQFVENTVGATLEDTALRMEAYCVSGVQGVVDNQLTRTLKLKGQLSSLILSKLQDTAQRANRGLIKSMNYKNFASAITVKYGIVAESWATKFETPSALSHLETEIALRAWETGTTRFRALTAEEWRTWLDSWYNPQTISSPSPSTEHASLASSENATPAENANATPTENANATPAENANATLAENANATPAENAIPAENAPPTNGLPEKRASTDTELAAPAAKRIQSRPMAVNFINSVTPAAGESFNVLKATRKKRSDAGIPRGPRKKSSENAPPQTPANAPSENTPPSGDPPAVQPSKSRSQRGKKASAPESAVAAS